MTLPPEYQPRYVSFIDVLGFDRVENIGKDHTVFDQILNINSVIDEAAVEARKLGAAFNRDDVQWTAFSDTVVLSLPESGHAMPDLFMFMISTAALCQNLLSSEILTRGGIAKGHAYHKDRTLFGPAIIDAYRLEHDIAVAARVVVSPEVTEIWQRTFNPPNDLGLAEMIKQDHDGAFFVDPFFFPEGDSIDRATEAFFLKSKPAIERLFSNATRLRHWTKVAWLASQYNQSGLVARRKKYPPIVIPSSPAK